MYGLETSFKCSTANQKYRPSWEEEQNKMVLVPLHNIFPAAVGEEQVRISFSLSGAKLCLNTHLETLSAMPPSPTATTRREDPFHEAGIFHEHRERSVLMEHCAAAPPAAPGGGGTSSRVCSTSTSSSWRTHTTHCSSSSDTASHSDCN
ncbi:hypothetical protein EYF80_062980 [Liparis tanakae]|uniref:Uncharacterized protein n=1 Tax=Liparis tanakae TaxID=230148 RepID=A0A4Z2EDQ5_9TELE|nr:hypothetical protein EYF80_062980 [Liparis tanakae]